VRRIITDPRILGGKPVIEDTRMSVEQVLGLLANGMSVEEIVEEYPLLTADDVRLAVRYARDSLQNDIVLDVRTA